MPPRLVLFAWLALTLSACGGGEKPPPPPESYLSHKGEVTPLRTALAGISFRPFIPSRQIVETALIPAFNSGDDTRANRGIAFEYVSNHQSFALSQWPGHGAPTGSIPLPAERGCAMSAYHIVPKPTPPPEPGASPPPTTAPPNLQGVLWWHKGIVMNLVPTGNATPRATIAEARRIIRLGACR